MEHRTNSRNKLKLYIFLVQKHQLLMLITAQANHNRTHNYCTYATVCAKAQWRLLCGNTTGSAQCHWIFVWSFQWISHFRQAKILHRHFLDILSKSVLCYQNSPHWEGRKINRHLHPQAPTHPPTHPSTYPHTPTHLQTHTHTNTHSSQIFQTVNITQTSDFVPIQNFKSSQDISVSAVC